MTEQKPSSSIRRATWRTSIWIIVYGSICIVGFPWIRQMLPRTVHLTWSRTIQIQPGAQATIEGSRMLNGEYSVKQPLDSAEIRWIDSRGEHPSIMVGPNDSICQYKDGSGQAIRGSVPPDADYLTGWLKECDAPVSSAVQIAETAAPVFDNQSLAKGELPGWTLTQNSHISELTYSACMVTLFLIGVAGIWVCMIPRKR